MARLMPTIIWTEQTDDAWHGRWRFGKVRIERTGQLWLCTMAVGAASGHQVRCAVQHNDDDPSAGPADAVASVEEAVAHFLDQLEHDEAEYLAAVKEVA